MMPDQPVNAGGYGWRPDKPDLRDHHYTAPRLGAFGARPEKVDLTAGFSPPYDQGDLGSCTANAIAAALEFDQRKQAQKKPFQPSRLFIYYNERVIEGTVGSDAGAEIRDGIKSVAEFGAPPETKWPYRADKFTTKPTQAAYRSARAHQALRYERVGQNDDLKSCLASGYPVVFGFSVYESFESAAVAQSGLVPMPAKGEAIIGGHAVAAVGYDEASRTFLCRNSWGTDWGMNGYFRMPYEYVLENDLADDFWVIKSVEGR